MTGRQPAVRGNQRLAPRFAVICHLQTKQSTARMRDEFAAAAARAARQGAGAKGTLNLGEGDQRTEEWLALREGRLTASAFCNALG